MTYDYTQQPVTFLATAHSGPSTSKYNQLFWIGGLVLIAVGLFTIFFSGDLSYFWYQLKMGLWFIIPGTILYLTRFYEISWDDQNIYYRTIRGKKAVARIDDVQDWGNFYAIAGTWVKFDNAPTLIFNLFMSNSKDLENMIGREIARKRPDQFDGNDSLLSPDMIFVAVLVFLAVGLYFINGG